MDTGFNDVGVETGLNGVGLAGLIGVGTDDGLLINMGETTVGVIRPK